jgi:hypothetical protein
LKFDLLSAFKLLPYVKLLDKPASAVELSDIQGIFSTAGQELPPDIVRMVHGALSSHEGTIIELMQKPEVVSMLQSLLKKGKLQPDRSFEAVFKCPHCGQMSLGDLS